MSVNVKELKNKVIDGAGVTDLTEDELAECLDFCCKSWTAWRKSNANAERARKITALAMKDPEVKALMASKGMTL